MTFCEAAEVALGEGPPTMKLFADYTPAASRRPPLTSSDGLGIRVADERDLLRIAQLHVAREGGDVDAALSHLREEIRHGAATGRGLLLAAVVQGEAVGYARTGYFTPAADAPANSVPEGWYLQGVIVDPEWRRRGIGAALTRARLEWITARADVAWYFASAQNRVSIDLHQRLGFVEWTRDFHVPGASFTGGEGILFVWRATRPEDVAASS